MGNLAINGGSSIRNTEKAQWPKWPVWGEEEKKGLIEVLESGQWAYNGPKERAFIDAWKSYIGTDYAVCAANGTVTLQLALESLGIGFGDEVIVPGITWQATAASALDINAVPVLVDVEDNTWCIDPELIEKAITPRTKAIIPVHLYGCIADMDAIMYISKKYNLKVIEDASHQHGSEWKGKKVGSIGDIGSFSMQLSKVLTAGEGGALTTNDKNIYMYLDALRNCGRKPEMSDEVIDRGAGRYGEVGDFIQSGNYRITEFQAAVLLEGIKRIPEQTRLREENAMYLNSLLEKEEGIFPMKRDERTSVQAYFNFAFRYHKECFNDLPVGKFRTALQAELGIKVDACYQPLNKCSLYRPLTKKRYRISDDHWKAIDPARFELPVCENAYHEESVVFHHTMLMGTKKDMDMVVEAIKKIRDNYRELI